MSRQFLSLLRIVIRLNCLCVCTLLIRIFLFILRFIAMHIAFFINLLTFFWDRRSLNQRPGEMKDSQEAKYSTHLYWKFAIGTKNKIWIYFFNWMLGERSDSGTVISANKFVMHLLNFSTTSTWFPCFLVVGFICLIETLYWHSFRTFTI